MTDSTTPDNTEESVTQVTPDNTEENSDSQDLTGVGEKFQESSRTAKLAKKEASKYTQFVQDGEVDIDGIKEVYRGNKISEKALELFCSENELDIDDIKSQLADPMQKIQELEKKLAELSQKPEPTFTDILQTQLKARGVSNADFLKYRDEFEEELEDLSGLAEDKAIAKALDYVLKPKSTVKIGRPDANNKSAPSGIWSQDKYMSFLTKRSTEVGNDKAVAELEGYEADRKAKGEPMFK